MVNISIKKLEKNKEFWGNSRNNEIYLVILSGKCAISIKDGEYIWEDLGNRESVFEGTPDSVYIPCNSQYKVLTKEKEVKFAIISTESNMDYEPFVIRHNEVKGEKRGKDEWQRTVYDIIKPTHAVNSIIVGETIHTGGVWSGYPPHKHDTDDGVMESRNKEMYYVEIEPQNAFAIFIQYGKDWQKSTVLKNGDCILVEEGYHAVVSAGGTKFYYLWALDSNEHKFICKTDEEYAWIEE